MEKFWIVFLKEYLQRVKKPSFIILTILTPLIFLAVILVPMIMGSTMADTSDKTVVVLDSTGKYLPFLTASSSKENFKFVPGNEDLSAYRSDAESPYYAFVTITDDLSENPKAITIFSHASLPPALEEHISSVLKDEIRDERLAKYDLPNLRQILDDSKVTLDISSVQWSKDGGEKNVSGYFGMIVGQIFNVLLMLFVTIYGAMVMNSVIEEKKSRIVEIIASSVRPTTLMSAKILAIGLLGITQLFIWAAVVVLGFVIVQSVYLSTVTFDVAELQRNISAAGAMSPENAMSFLAPLADFDFGTIIFSFVFYFICCYVSFAAIYAAVGSAFENPEDANQITLPFSMIELFAFYGAIYSFQNPNGPLAFWGSFVPLFGPMFMLIRIPFDPPYWQILLSYAINVAFMVLFVWMAAKVFRVGLLMYGKKPSFKELIKWMRFS